MPAWTSDNGVVDDLNGTLAMAVLVVTRHLKLMTCGAQIAQRVLPYGAGLA